MDTAGVEVGEIGGSGGRADLSVHAIARFEDDFVALLNLEKGRDVGMIPVVAAVRFTGKWLRSVDADGVLVHGRGSREMRSLILR